MNVFFIRRVAGSGVYCLQGTYSVGAVPRWMTSSVLLAPSYLAARGDGPYRARTGKSRVACRRSSYGISGGGARCSGSAAGVGKRNEGASFSTNGAKSFSSFLASSSWVPMKPCVLLCCSGRVVSSQHHFTYRFSFLTMCTSGRSSLASCRDLGVFVGNLMRFADC